MGMEMSIVLSCCDIKGYNRLRDEVIWKSKGDKIWSGVSFDVG